MSTNPEKYLGLPTMVGRRKKEAFHHYLNRFSKKVECCSIRYLSMGSKEVFIKAILQAIPLYTMQCFLLPKIMCSKLENILNKFWWGNNKSSNGIHWSTWHSLYLPKVCGGLSFRDLTKFNDALLAKQC